MRPAHHRLSGSIVAFNTVHDTPARSSWNCVLQALPAQVSSGRDGGQKTSAVVHVELCTAFWRNNFLLTRCTSAL